MYVDWKSNSVTAEIYDMKKINFKTFERIVKTNQQRENIILTHLKNIKII